MFDPRAERHVLEHKGFVAAPELLEKIMQYAEAWVHEVQEQSIIGDHKDVTHDGDWKRGVADTLLMIIRAMGGKEEDFHYDARAESYDDHVKAMEDVVGENMYGAPALLKTGEVVSSPPIDRSETIWASPFAYDEDETRAMD